MSGTDHKFAGSIPAIYESHFVPLIFEHYAHDLAARAASTAASRVLEIAAGTGVLTRALVSALPASTTIVATDLNPAMIAEAERIGTSRPVQWEQADAMRLPFADRSFDLVTCQFGAMFFPDKPAAYAEVRRVLAPGGTFLFNVWDRIEDNELALASMDALASFYPGDPPRFMARVPHGYFDPATITRDLALAGFSTAPSVKLLTARSRAPSALHAAIGICQGSPLRNELEARDATRVDEATEAVARMIAQRFGDGEVDARMQALVVSVKLQE